jgi:transposase InsO family protein
LEAAHDALIGGGHFRVDKTYCKVTDCWWGPGVYKDVYHWVSSCTTCGTMRRRNTVNSAPLQPIPAYTLFELIGMDIVGPLPITSKGHRFILVITDHFSKWAVAVSMAHITTKDIAAALVERVILAGYDTPTRILTDRASNFNSELARKIYKLLGIHKKTTSAYHPQCNRHTECFNDTLMRTLAKMLQSILMTGTN